MNVVGPITYTLVEVTDGVNEVYLNPRELADALKRAGALQAAGYVLLIAAHVEELIAQQ